MRKIWDISGGLRGDFARCKLFQKKQPKNNLPLLQSGGSPRRKEKRLTTEFTGGAE
jgi:hypothetical protein